MKFKLFLFLPLFVAGMVACSSDDDTDNERTPDSVNPMEKPRYLPMSIVATENPLEDAAAANSNSKKAPVTTLASFDSFLLWYDYYLEDYESYRNNLKEEWTARKATGSPTKWTCGDEGQYGWPEDATATGYGESDDIPVSWFGIANLATDKDNFIEQDEDDMHYYVQFKVEESSTSQKDLLVAWKTETWARCKGVMGMSFDHVCSALRFNVKKAKNVANNSIYLKKVSLCNVKNKGVFALPNGPWRNVVAEDSKFTLFETDSSTPNGLLLDDTDNYKSLYAGTLGTDDDNAYLFMIPQQIEGWTGQGAPSGVHLEIVLTLDNVGTQVAYIPMPLTFNLEKGKRYEVNVNLGKSTMLDQYGNQIIQ